MTKGRAWRYGVQKMTATQRTVLAIVPTAGKIHATGLGLAMTLTSAAGRVGATRVIATPTRSVIRRAGSLTRVIGCAAMLHGAQTATGD